MRADKKTVVDEVWDEARIVGFLDKEPMGAEPADFSLLLNAYRSMRPSDFERFVAHFRNAGRNLDERNQQGQTLAEAIAEHGKSAPFLDVLRSAGAAMSP